jgi:excisionase family DNA binding protein
MQMKGEVLLSKDVALILDCSPDEVVDLARKGRLPAVKQGKFWRFHRSDVMVYKRLKNKTNEGPARSA